MVIALGADASTQKRPVAVGDDGHMYLAPSAYASRLHVPTADVFPKPAKSSSPLPPTANSTRSVELGIRYIVGSDLASYTYRNNQRQRILDLAAEGELQVPRRLRLGKHGDRTDYRAAPDGTSQRPAGPHPLAATLRSR